MQKVEPIEATKEEIGEQWSLGERFISEVAALFDRFYSYASKLNTTCIAILGFFLAFLIQLKLKGKAVPYKAGAIFIFFTLTVAICIGLYLRAKLEIIDWYRRFTAAWKGFQVFIKKASSIINEKGGNIEQDIGLDFEVESLEKLRLSIPYKSLKVQFCTFVIALISLILYFAFYLFA